MSNELKNIQVHESSKYKNIFRFEPVFILGMIIFGVIFIYCWLAYFGNGLEKYTDIVCEFTSIWNSNKSSEMNLVYILAILGAGATFAYYVKFGKITTLHMIEKNDISIKILITALIIATTTYYFVYIGTNPLLFSILMLTIVMYIVNKERALDTVILFIANLYAVVGIYRLYVLFGGNQRIDILNVAFISLIISFSMFIISINLLAKIFLLAQLFIPFTLLIFITSSYKVASEIKILIMPRIIIYLVWFIIICFLVLSIKNLLKNWNNKTGLENIISFGTLVCIMNFNNYSGAGQIISSDLHHPFENIIAFSQIIELGQKPFAEYIPVSGMYSFIQGFYLWLFGQGHYALYNVTENLYYLTIIFIVILLLRKHIRDDWVLFVSLLIPIMRYNRVALIIPIMLFLALPKLIKNKNLWLKAWLLTSLVHGLYYPVYGAAVCLGYLPMAIYQLMTFIQNEFAEKRKKIKFWIEWILTIMPILLSIPMLLGTLKHMLAMGAQTVYADGISRFGQTLPNNFFSYIQSIGIRLLIYYSFTFLIQASVIWMSAYFLVKTGGFILKNKRVKCNDIEASTLSITFGIAMLVAFTYTLVRIDINSIYARSAGIIYGSVVMIIILSARYLKENKALFTSIGIAVFFVAAVSGEAIFSFNYSSKLEPYYTVPQDYILVNDDHVPRLGECFVQKWVYDNVVAHFDATRSLDKNKGYIGLGSFGHYYLSSIKGDSVMESGTIKGFGAAQETIDLIRKNGSVVNVVDSCWQYYLYRWLLMSGEYIWNTTDGRFYPKPDDISIAEAREIHKDLEVALGLAIDERPLGRTPSSWGSSIQSLRKIFTEVPIGTKIIKNRTGKTIKFDKKFNGEDADFIFIEFAGVNKRYENILFNHGGDFVQNELTYFNERLMKKDYNRGRVVIISWTDDKGEEHSLNCSMGRGKLLIPLGGGCNWLMNSHDSVFITVNNGGKVPVIANVELLKVREVK